jgi:hypothetical protein
MIEVILSVSLLGVFLAIPYGIGSWINWQLLKTGTILPRGAIVEPYGKILAPLFQWPCYAYLIYQILEGKVWQAIAAFIIMWFVSGWLAQWLERKAYQNDREIDVLSDALIAGHEIPEWWVKLTNKQWQERLFAETEKRGALKG